MSDKKEKKDEQKSEKINELEQKIQELDDQLKRAVADYRNYEKRVEAEKKELIKYANRELLLSLLPSFDMLFLAEKYVQDDGLKLTIKSLSDSLGNAGVTRIETQGKIFDPELMECIETVDGEEETVIEEIRPGFLLHGRTLRPAAVKVGKSGTSN